MKTESLKRWWRYNEAGSWSEITCIFIRKENLATHTEGRPWRHRKKMDICKPVTEISVNPTLLVPWAQTSSSHKCEERNFCSLNTQPVVFCYGNPSKLIHAPRSGVLNQQLLYLTGVTWPGPPYILQKNRELLWKLWHHPLHWGAVEHLNLRAEK
jgi:hypothetical protein